LLAWDDMFRHWSILELMTLRVNQQHMFQPCVWVYSGSREDFDIIISDTNLNNLCLEFRKIWVSSAFRGAHSPSKTLPDL